MKGLAALLLVVAIVHPRVARSCSCDGIQSIESAIADAEAVVIVRVLRVEEPNYTSPSLTDSPVVVEVTDSLKGGAKGQLRIATDIMCYRSFNLDDLKIGEAYVLPIDSFEKANRGGWYTLRPLWGDGDQKDLTKGLYILPSCSNNALEVNGSGLYTATYKASRERVAEWHMPLFVLKAALPMGWLGYWRLVSAAVVGVIFMLIGLFVLKLRRRRSAV